MNTQTYPKPRALAIVVGIIGLALALPGAALLVSGGSAYYVLAGLVLSVCSVLLFRGDYRAGTL